MSAVSTKATFIITAENPTWYIANELKQCEYVTHLSQFTSVTAPSIHFHKSVEEGVKRVIIINSDT